MYNTVKLFHVTHFCTFPIYINVHKKTETIQKPHMIRLHTNIYEYT